MIELSDYYERDEWEDVIALTNIAKRISGDPEIQIIWHRNDVTYTDGNRIYIPEKHKNQFKVSRGLNAHEAGHIGYGTFELDIKRLHKYLSKKYGVSDEFAQILFNVVEDVRINNINKEKFPGFRDDLDNHTKSMLPKIKESISKTENILFYILLNWDGYTDFQDKPNFKNILISDEDWNKIEFLKRFLLKYLSINSSIVVCDQLCKILVKYFPKPEDRRKISEMSSDKTIDNASRKGGKRGKIKRGGERTMDELEKEDFDIDDLEDLFEDGDKSSDEMKKDKGNNKKENELENGDKGKTDSSTEGSEESKSEGGKSDKSSCSNSKGGPSDGIGKSDADLKDWVKRLKKTLESKKSSLKMPLDELKKAVEKSKEISKRNRCNEKLKELIDKLEKLLKRKIEKEASKEALKKAIDYGENALEKRLKKLEADRNITDRAKCSKNIKVTDTTIEKSNMEPISLTYNQIVRKYARYIQTVRLNLSKLRNHIGRDDRSKMGRLNSRYLRAVTSRGKFRNVFTRERPDKKLRIVVIVDISWSMQCGSRLSGAKTALVMLCEALKDTADIKVVLFTGRSHATNILVKDFEESVDIRKFDKFGCHQKLTENLDGVSIKHEAGKLNGDELIVVISDGKPLGYNYRLEDAIQDVREVCTKFRTFAFSIDANGKHLEILYGKNWILTHSSKQEELGTKIVDFAQMVARNFYKS